MAKKTYGSRGQTWHEDFIEYVEDLARRPEYAGMPDAYTSDERVQWEAPSNRQSGQFKDTHHKRRDWWRNKAVTLGIDPNSPQWISRTAKALHPTKAKPCKRCGRVMRLEYVYPQQRLLERLRRLPGFDASFEFQEFEPIDELIGRLVSHHSEKILRGMGTALDPFGGLGAPTSTSLRDWQTWLANVYIPSEPPILSPGAMSNAPDRFDGFHSFNLCCRGKADTGRHVSNLSSYVTDRRVFEFWNDGDWIVADRLMGMVRTAVKDARCYNDHDGPCSADHIGPLSLGFTHRPEFQLLCRPCNSGKNNRLSARDVRTLRNAEGRGEEVISWHSQALWDARKNDVVDDETALRLTKMLRDNRRTMMLVLGRLLDEGHLTFLASFLRLADADSDIDIDEVLVDDSIVTIHRVRRNPRTTKYAAEQKARRLRIAFGALAAYVAKEKRNGLAITNPEVERGVREVLDTLANSNVETKTLDQQLAKALCGSDEQLREIAPLVQAADDPAFEVARRALEGAMFAAATEIAAKWNDERYVRAARDETEDA